MCIRCKIPPVVFIGLILWFGAPVGSQTATSESSNGTPLKTADTKSPGVQTWSIKPTSSAEFTNLNTQGVPTLSSGQFMAANATTTLELNSKTVTTIQDVPLTPSSTESGAVPSILPSSTVTRPLSEALFSSSSDISITTGQLTPSSSTTEPTTEASLPLASNISLTTQSPTSSSSYISSEVESTESSGFQSHSQLTHAIQPTSTEWGTATVSTSDTFILQSTTTESTSYSGFVPMPSSTIAPTQFSHLSSLTSTTQSSFLPSSSSSVVITPTATTWTTTTSTSGYVTVTPATKPTGSGSPPGQGEDEDEKEPVEKGKSDLSSGTKTTIAIIATLCVLGVIIAGVLLYRRYNITHRSLKTFLTSGVRYKTYNNATYKDDEGMLIMPDRR